MPSGSLELELKVTGAPLSTSLALSPKAGCGGRLVTVMSWETVRTLPALSVTRRETVCVPLVFQLVVTSWPVLSPKVPLLSRSQDSATGRPSGSLELEVSVTGWPVSTADGLEEKAATGARLAATVIVFEVLRHQPSSSITSSRTV